MSIADDQLKPAAEAFADVADRQATAARAAIDPVQRKLPGVVPAFNFEGCYLELERQAVIVEQLRKEYEDDARVAKESKKLWDDAEERFTKMALEFRRRRQAKDEEREERAQHPGADASGRLVACLFEQQQTEDTCPFCRGDVAPHVFERFGINVSEIAPPDIDEHVEQARAFYVTTEVEETLEALEQVDTFVDAGLIKGWTPEERKAVTLWADAVFDRDKNKHADVVVPERPAVLGTPHIPAKPDAEGRQVCSLCDEVLIKSSVAGEIYEETAFVGTDCARKPKPEGHRYPASVKKPAGSKKSGGKKKGGR
jgi:hypothetical protein